MVSKPRSHWGFDEDALRRMEDDWFLQRLRGNVALSSALLDDTYVGGTSAGGRMTKADFLASIHAMKEEEVSVSHADRLIRRVGDAIVSSGVAELVSPTRTHRFRYLRVYQVTRDGPRLVASQSAVVR